MRRREFLLGIGGAATCWPAAAPAQRSAKIARLGWLSTGRLDSAESKAFHATFWQGLNAHGYVEGRNLIMDYRAAEGRIERFLPLAKELVELKVDIIVAANSAAAQGARQATSAVPIVVQAMGDPVGEGLVASLARPGGNITGLTFLGAELMPKCLALLKEALPKVARIAALWHPSAYVGDRMRIMREDAAAAAVALGVNLHFVTIQSPDELETGFAEIARQRFDAVLGFPSPMLFVERRRIADLLARHSLPSIHNTREFAELGGLVSYGANLHDIFRRSATYVDKILKGAKPADLPVEQPTKFELVINLKTAMSLGVAIPPTLLARADEVIE